MLHFHWKWELWALRCFCRPLLCCVCCTVYMPSGLLTRFSALLSSRCSVQCQWIIHHPYHTTPTTSHRHYTRQDLLDIGAASSSSAGPLSPLLITHLRHLGLACNQPRKPRRGGRNELQKINVRVDSIDHPLTPFLPSLTANTTLLTQTPPQLVTDAKSHFSSNSHHQKQGNLIHINPNQNNNGPTVTVFNTKSVGPKESK